MQHMKWQGRNISRETGSPGLWTVLTFYVNINTYVQAHGTCPWVHQYVHVQARAVPSSSILCLIALWQALSVKMKFAVSARLASQWVFKKHLTRTPIARIQTSTTVPDYRQALSCQSTDKHRYTRVQTSMVMLRSICEHQDSTSNPQTLVLVEQVLLPPSHLLDPSYFLF